MVRYNMRSVLMLAIFAAAVGLVVGCQSADTDDSASTRLDLIAPRINTVVKDPASRDELLEICEKMSSLAEAEGRNNAEAQQHLLVLHRSPTATREDFVTIFTRQRESQRRVMEEMLALRLQAAELMTDQEWSSLVP